MRIYFAVLFHFAILTASVFGSGDPTLATYYIGFDGDPKPRNGSDGNPYPNNPNYNRLTMLFAHSYIADTYPTKTINHYHPLGAPRYTGASTNPATTFSNARTPEGTREPLTLQPGEGQFTGKFVSNRGSATSSEYDALTIRSIESLRSGNGPMGTAPTTPFSYANLNPTSATYDADWQNYLSTASGDWLMLNSSPIDPTTFTENGGTYAGSVVDVTVGMQLVDITPGLDVYRMDGSTLFSGGAGSVERLGILDASFSFTPVFGTSTGPSASPALYDAKFKLVDLSTGASLLGDSGEFRYSFQVVPEPASVSILSLTLVACAMRATRRGRTAKSSA